MEETSTTSGRSFLWKQVTHPRSCLPQWEDTLPDPPDEPKAPIEYFRYFFDDELLDAITEQSNLFAIQKNANKALCLTCCELEQFLSTTMYMSIYSLPRSRMYWSHETRVEKVAAVMSRDRWQTIKNSLHFNDNNLLEVNAGKDRLFKIRPLIDNLLPKFQSLPKSQMLVVDEQMVRSKVVHHSNNTSPASLTSGDTKYLSFAISMGLLPTSPFTLERLGLFQDYLTLVPALTLYLGYRVLFRRTRTTYSFLTTGSRP